ncbi:MAG: YdcF family protein [Bacteroidota bacterium]
MFFVLSKLLRFAISPTSWVVLLVIYVMLTKKTGRKKIASYLLAGFLIFFTNPLISNLVMTAWETAPVPYDKISHHEYGILLTGVTVSNQQPNDRTHYKKGVDRVLHTVDLWKKGIIDQIVVTGGSGLISGSKQSEAAGISKTLIAAGIPKEKIILEEAARNTAENAINTQQLIGTEKKVLLITSAFHMPRASGCFKKAGFQATPFATDLYSTPITWEPDSWLLPNSTALHKWDILTKEWVGYIVYVVKGYI